ncbi:MAG: hypothetical protein NWS71_10510 [Opitutales bacterium]|jgi:hypothetical protein|nr:hypothetical protein [Opitutales bacterium]MDP4694539.1 hypothetical protein [Opitutales bacterium]MDP4776835.1 hypothetical protein [Opitutales bacterium]MDP4879565.1 hypothetical protein [Opitutales bacterium]MDP4883269.1 hypothetical protein [Opitutales bacterium]
MPNPTSKLTWCKARLGEDMNWWIKEISDPVHWDVDGLGVIDPRQFQHILDLIEPLSDYGLQTDIVEEAFYSFGIDEIEEDKTILLKRIKDSILDSDEQIFALPDVLDEEKGPYADFIDHITKLRIKLLNDLIDFSKSLTVEELEEEIRETQNADYMEGRASHFFNEISAILEYVPKGFELDEDEESTGPKSEDEVLEKDLADVDAGTEVEENIVADETMKWDEEEEEEDKYEETTSPPDEDAEDEKK